MRLAFRWKPSIHPRRLPGVIAVALLMTLICGAQSKNFRVIGPGGGGAMFHPTISPHDAKTVFVACDMTGAYVTHDGGATWRMFNLRGVVQAFQFDPVQPHVAYAITTGLWRTEDDGESWKLVLPTPTGRVQVQSAGDHADETILPVPGQPSAISAIAVDPSDPHTLYLSADSQHPALYRSTDYGAHWNRIASLSELSLHIWVDGSSSAADRQLLIAGAKTLSFGRASALRVTRNPVAYFDLSAGESKSGAWTVLGFSAEGQAFSTVDEGATWTPLALPGAGAQVRMVTVSAHDPAVAYVSYRKLKLGADEWYGVAKTTDGGSNWSLVMKATGSMQPTNVHDAWIGPAFGGDWGEEPLGLAVADQDNRLVYATDLGRAFKTEDGGALWTPVYSHRAANGKGWTSNGLDVTNAYGIHFDPHHPHRQFLTMTDISLFRSDDDGRSWLPSADGVPDRWKNTTYWVVFDPTVPDRMWSASSYNHDLPRPKMWRRTDTDHFRGGVSLSEDGGRTWKPSNLGMPETATTHLVLDPSSPANARVLYATGFGRGVYKSIDGGRHWELKNTGITQIKPLAWRLVLTEDRTLYLVVARRSENGGIGNEDDGALYRSTDGAAHWTPVPLPEGVNGPNGLAVDPRNGRRLYLATWARAAGQHGVGGGVFVSDDAGAHWKQTLADAEHVYDVSIDPGDASVLYACGFESSAYRSADAGESWHRVPGYNFKWGQRVIVDPRDPRSIYITTFGGGVWHGPAQGAEPSHDIATKEMQP